MLAREQRRGHAVLVARPPRRPRSRVPLRRRTRARRPSAVPARPSHLNPVSVSANATPWCRGDLGQQRRRDDRGRDEPVVARRASTHRSSPSRRAELVAARASATPLRGGTATQQRSASGSFATTRSAPILVGECDGEVDRAGLLGVRERDGRELGVRVRPARRRRRPRSRRRARSVRHHRAADAVQRRVGDAQVPRRRTVVRRRRSPPRRRTISASSSTTRDARRAAWPAGTRRRGEAATPPSIVGVGRRDDLGAVVVVDLVAVVPRRVVAGGHDDAGGRADASHRERGQRRGQRPVEHVHCDAGSSERRRAVSAANAAEPWRASRPTTTPADAAAGALAQRPSPRPRRRCGARRAGSSPPGRHRRRRGAPRSRSVSGGSKRSCSVADVAARRGARCELGARRLVRVRCDPRASTARSSAGSTRAPRGSQPLDDAAQEAAEPRGGGRARREDLAVVERRRRDARGEVRRRARARAPRRRGASRRWPRAPSTCPTRSAPSVRSIRISAGVS